MSTLIPEFAHLQNRLVVPVALGPKEEDIFLRHVAAVNERFFADEDLNGDGFYEIPEDGNPVLAKKIAEGLQKLCDLTGVPALIGRDAGCWRIALAE
jgi:hypothetical protein